MPPSSPRWLARPEPSRAEPPEPAPPSPSRLRQGQPRGRSSFPPRRPRTAKKVPRNRNSGCGGDTPRRGSRPPAAVRPQACEMAGPLDTPSCFEALSLPGAAPGRRGPVTWPRWGGPEQVPAAHAAARATCPQRPAAGRRRSGGARGLDVTAAPRYLPSKVVAAAATGGVRRPGRVRSPAVPPNEPEPQGCPSSYSLFPYAIDP